MTDEDKQKDDAALTEMFARMLSLENALRRACTQPHDEDQSFSAGLLRKE